MPTPPFSKILAALRQHIYEVLGPAEPVEVPEPHAIFRIVEVDQRKELYITVDDYIEDPAVSDFFVVLKKTSEEFDAPWVCFYRDQFVLAKITMSKGKFGRFSIPLVRKRFPPLLV